MSDPLQPYQRVFGVPEVIIPGLKKTPRTRYKIVIHRDDFLVIDMEPVNGLGDGRVIAECDSWGDADDIAEVMEEKSSAG